MKGRNDVVSASEIATWVWCPESWRLDSLGAEPSNHAALGRGERDHARKARYEARSRMVLVFGWCLLAASLLIFVLLAAYFVLAGG